MWILWISVGIVLGILLKSMYSRTPLHDQGFSIGRFSSQETLEKVAKALHGLNLPSARPRWRLDSDNVRRIIFPSGKIMNWTDETLQSRLGVDCAHAFVARNPQAQAQRLANRLVNAGLTARVIPDFDESVRQGTMAMVVIDGERIGIIFRRDVKQMGGPRPTRYKSRG
jgi:hypothetical protein